MPIKGDWQLGAEGVTVDTLARLLYRTALNPLFTLPLFLASRLTAPGADLAAQHPTALRRLNAALLLGLLYRAGNFLNAGVANNWSNDAYDWAREVVVVTGGSDGIGAKCVKLLAERGVKVAVLDVQEPKYELPPTATFFQCDLASEAAIASTCASIRAALGAPTVLVNNAGVARGKPLLSTTPADLRLTFAVNALAHYHLARELLPSMVAANHGMVVTVASVAAHVAAPRMVDYAATKAAALAFHEGLSAELPTLYKAPRVRTVAVCQGYTRTPLFEGFEDRDARVNYTLEPDTVAEAIVRAVLAGRSDHIMLPGIGWFVSRQLRGWPLWMQYGLRKRLARLMDGWQGRQVDQPSEEKKGE